MSNSLPASTSDTSSHPVSISDLQDITSSVPIMTPPSSRKSTSTPSDPIDKYISAKFKKRTSSIVEWLNKTTSKLGGKYVLVVVAPDDGTDIYFNSPMAKFVDNFLLEKDIVEYLSKGSDGDIDPDRPRVPSIATSTKPNTSTKCKAKLDLCNHDRVISFLTQGLVIIQQATCKALAKSWIREIEPKKQTNYPYKLGDMSKPDWWPYGVRHKEPDHLNKDERVQLLVGLLTHEDISIRRIREAAMPSIRDTDPDKLALLEELYIVADSEKQFLNGNLDESDQIVEVTDLNYWDRQTKIAIPSSNPTTTVKKEKESGSQLKSSSGLGQGRLVNIAPKSTSRAVISSPSIAHLKFDAHQHFAAVTSDSNTSISSPRGHSNGANNSSSLRIASLSSTPSSSLSTTTCSSSSSVGSNSTSSSGSSLSTSASSVSNSSFSANSGLSSSFCSNPIQSPNSSNSNLSYTSKGTPLTAAHYLSQFDTWPGATPLSIPVAGITNRMMFLEHASIPSSSPFHDVNISHGFYMANRTPHKPIRTFANQELDETPSRTTSGQKFDDIGTSSSSIEHTPNPFNQLPLQQLPLPFPLPLQIQSENLNVLGKRPMADRFIYLDDDNTHDENRFNKKFDNGNTKVFYQEETVLKFES
ncbi:hypothetical protein AWJ20_2279 [Sugiyamaella lignohabitans]|uniref:Subtelomeric hrmA-associated cluster protein AFUB-079030/YDR124W-like helical bundle domain-containing protein n=1 Tax=Sugiyamaella lignohabitans TaxID=796027 RepID=A0A167F0M1_9ASCO|nr:uncharacterized protein AWJ20_2279 [Sugiyamaella lignohabitans]ANB14674.1 hypothetical protein AWJ20_2279 [Sugiyamaella lignohabitans]